MRNVQLRKAYSNTPPFQQTNVKWSFAKNLQVIVKDTAVLIN